MTYYFAYGSNLSTEQMRQRCPNSRFIDKARLDGWRFIYSHNGYASIIEDKNTFVWGAIFKLSPQDEVTLDGYEGVSTQNYRKDFISLDGFDTIMTYIAVNNDESLPYDNYHRHIIHSARKLGLPNDYIEKNILSWKTSGKKSPRDYIHQ